MIANRYLQRDYARLKNSGIEMEEQLFSLEKMMVKYENMDQDKNALALWSSFHQPGNQIWLY